ncbi:hypothetical protein [Schaalia sp. lx-100]|nr:hypothetical protein [Schaalia sp. lx-100]
MLTRRLSWALAGGGASQPLGLRGGLTWIPTFPSTTMESGR